MSYLTHQPVLIKRGSIGGMRASPYAPMAAPIYSDAAPQMRYVMSTPMRYRPMQDIRGSSGPNRAAPIQPRQHQPSGLMTATSISSNPFRRQNIVPMYQQQQPAIVQPQPETQMIMMVPTGAAGQQFQMPTQQYQLPGPQNIERIQMSENPYHLVPYGSTPHHSATCNIL